MKNTPLIWIRKSLLFLCLSVASAGIATPAHADYTSYINLALNPLEITSLFSITGSSTVSYLGGASCSGWKEIRTSIWESATSSSPLHAQNTNFEPFPSNCSSLEEDMQTQLDFMIAQTSDWADTQYIVFTIANGYHSFNNQVAYAVFEKQGSFVRVPEIHTRTFIESQAPLENELVYSSSTVALYSTYYVASEEIQDGAEVRACHIYNSIKNISGYYADDTGYQGTLCEDVLVFDEEHYIVSDTPQLSATGTYQVSHFILEQKTTPAPWWQIWEDDVVETRTLASDYSQFNIFVVTDPIEQQQLFDRHVAEQEAREALRQQEEGGDFGFVDKWLSLPEDILTNKHPFAWFTQLLTMLNEQAQETHATSTLEIVIPVFDVVDTSTTTGPISFSVLNTLDTPEMSATSSPFADGCSMLEDVLTVGTSTTPCEGFREITRAILYLVTIFAIGLLVWKLFKEF